MTDLGVPQLSNSTVVTINISPVNEFSPQFAHNKSAPVTVIENQDPGNGLVLFDLNATDKDFGEQGKLGDKYEVNIYFFIKHRYRQSVRQSVIM